MFKRLCCMLWNQFHRRNLKTLSFGPVTEISICLLRWLFWWEQWNLDGSVLEYQKMSHFFVDTTPKNCLRRRYLKRFSGNAAHTHLHRRNRSTVCPLECKLCGSRDLCPSPTGHPKPRALVAHGSCCWMRKHWLCARHFMALTLRAGWSWCF